MKDKVSGSSKEDIADVMREEKRRGRRPVDVKETKRQDEQKEAIRKIYRKGTEHDLRRLLREWKYSEEKIEEQVATFRRLRG